MNSISEPLWIYRTKVHRKLLGKCSGWPALCLGCGQFNKTHSEYLVSPNTDCPISGKCVCCHKKILYFLAATSTVAKIFFFLTLQFSFCPWKKCLDSTWSCWPDTLKEEAWVWGKDNRENNPHHHLETHANLQSQENSLSRIPEILEISLCSM